MSEPIALLLERLEARAVELKAWRDEVTELSEADRDGQPIRPQDVAEAFRDQAAEESREELALLGNLRRAISRAVSRIGGPGATCDHEVAAVDALATKCEEARADARLLAAALAELKDEWDIGGEQEPDLQAAIDRWRAR